MLEPHVKMVQAKRSKSPYKSMVVQVYHLDHPKKRLQEKNNIQSKNIFSVNLNICLNHLNH